MLSGGKKDDDGGDSGGGGGGDTPIPKGYNLYNVDQSTIVENNAYITGILDVQDAPPSGYKFEDDSAQNGGLKVNPKTIPLGANNPKLPKVHFEFG